MIENDMKNFYDEQSKVETDSIRSLKESFHLPLDVDGNHCDSGISSGQTEPSIVDHLSPGFGSTGSGIKKRNRGSDSSEEEWFSGRQRGRFTRTRQISKVNLLTWLALFMSILQSCRAIYDEVGVSDAVTAMKMLYQKVAEQKQLIMASLENDCSKEEINVQICVRFLQNLPIRFTSEFSFKNIPNFEL